MSGVNFETTTIAEKAIAGAICNIKFKNCNTYYRCHIGID